MPEDNTPPGSPALSNENDDSEFLEEDDIIEIIELPENEDEELEEEIDELNENSPVEDTSRLTFSQHKNTVLQCVYHPRMNVIATSGVDDMVYVWDSTNGSVIATCSGHSDSVDALGFNHDGSYLASGDLDGNIILWKTSDYSKSLSLAVAGELSWLRWHIGCNVLLAATTEGQISMFKIPSGEEKIIAYPFGELCSVACLMADGKRLVCGFSSCITVMDLKAATRLQHIKTEEYGAVQCMDVHKDNTLAITGHETGAVTLVNTHNGKLAGVLTEGDGGVEVVTFSKDGALPLAACCKCDVVMVFDVGRQTLRHVFNTGTVVTLLTWHPTRPFVYSAHTDGAVRAVDAREGAALSIHTGHRSTCCALAISPDGTELATGSFDHTAKVFSIVNL